MDSGGFLSKVERGVRASFSTGGGSEARELLEQLAEATRSQGLGVGGGPCGEVGSANAVLPL